jgi:hypothetical protein
MKNVPRGLQISKFEGVILHEKISHEIFDSRG